MARIALLLAGVFAALLGGCGSAPSTTMNPPTPAVKAEIARAGVPVALVEYTAVGKMVEDAKVGAWDMAVVAFDPARKSVLEFAPPHMVVDLTYLVAPGSSIRSVADADKPGVRIGAARGAATALFLQRELKGATVVPAENEPARLRGVSVAPAVR